MVDCIDLFRYVEPSPYLRDEANLIIVNNLSNIFFNLVWKTFIESFWMYFHKRYWFIFLIFEFWCGFSVRVIVAPYKNIWKCLFNF